MNIRLRITHSGTQPGTPVTSPVAFGLQRKGGDLVLPNATLAEGGRAIDLTVDTAGSSSDEVRFRGPFIHGSAKEQFLYLAWKRLDVQPGEGLWAWRLKIRLDGLTALGRGRPFEPEELVEADVEHLRPHRKESVIWRRARER
jgi:hypothetical protein